MSDRKLKLVLVTNAPLKSAEFLPELLSLVDTFAEVVLAEDVAERSVTLGSIAKRWVTAGKNTKPSLVLKWKNEILGE